jgi:hypothetical protein
MHSSSRSKTWPQRAAAIIVCIALFAVLYAGWQYWLYSGGIFRTSGFNEAAWKKLNLRTGDVSCYRGGMAADMRVNILRVGLPKSRVEALLGAPDIKRMHVYGYALGMCSGLRIDLDSLDVHFDAEDRIERVLLVQH